MLYPKREPIPTLVSLLADSAESTRLKSMSTASETSRVAINFAC